MVQRTLDAWYERFSRLYANATPIRCKDELDAAIHAAGLRYDQVTLDFLQALDERWVYRDSDSPFDDEQINQRYRHILERRL